MSPCEESVVWRSDNLNALTKWIEIFFLRSSSSSSVEPFERLLP